MVDVEIKIDRLKGDLDKEKEVSQAIMAMADCGKNDDISLMV